MSIGDGIGFAALMWAIVQLSYLWHYRSKQVTSDEIKASMDKIDKRLQDCLGPFE